MFSRNVSEHYRQYNPEPLVQETLEAKTFDETINQLDELEKKQSEEIKKASDALTPLTEHESALDRLRIGIKKEPNTPVDKYRQEFDKNPTPSNKLKYEMALRLNKAAKSGDSRAIYNAVMKDIHDLEDKRRALHDSYVNTAVMDDTPGAIKRKMEENKAKGIEIKKIEKQIASLHKEFPELKQIEEKGVTSDIARQLGLSEDRNKLVAQRDQLRKIKQYKEQIIKQKYIDEHKDDSWGQTAVENVKLLGNRISENVSYVADNPFSVVTLGHQILNDTYMTVFDSLWGYNSEIARNNPESNSIYKFIAGVANTAYSIPLGIARDASNLVDEFLPTGDNFDPLTGESRYRGTRMYDRYVDQRGRYTSDENSFMESYIIAPALQTTESVVTFGIESYLLGKGFGALGAPLKGVKYARNLPQFATALTTGWIEGQQVSDEAYRGIFTDAYYGEALSIEEAKAKAQYGARITKVTNAALIAGSDYIQLGALFRSGNKAGIRKLYQEAVENSISKGLSREVAQREAIKGLMNNPLTRREVLGMTERFLRDGGQEYGEETIINKFAEHLGVSAADKDSLFKASTWGDAIKETAHGFVELETQLGGIWGAIGGGTTHLFFNYAVPQKLDMNQIDENGNLLYVQADGTISTNVTDKVATTTEVVKGWELDRALRKQTVGQYLEASTNDYYFQTQAHTQLKIELEKET